MALVKTAVLLFAARGTTTLNLEHDRIWYDHYFFHASYGQAGYWIDQTDGERVLHGQVFDWIFYPEPFPDFSKRGETANLAIKAFETPGRSVRFVRHRLGRAGDSEDDGSPTAARPARNPRIARTTLS